MSEDAAQGTATGAGGNDSATVVHSTGTAGGNAALNPVFRTAPAADPATQQGAATQKPAGRQGAAQGQDDRSPEELLAEAAQGDGSDEDPLAKATAELAKWKQQARDNEKRAKLNAEKAKNFDAYEESQKTEQQRLADQLAAAQAEVTRERGERLRLLAAANYDLPPSLIGHLGNGTEDEINERAETLAAAINERAAVLAAAQAQAAQQDQPRTNGNGFRPVESLRPGALPASDNKPADPNAWIRQALGSRR